MTAGTAHAVLWTLAAYAAAGVAFAVPFLIFGIDRVDSGAKDAPFLFRLLVFPGVVALWPLIARKWRAARSGR